MSIKLEKNVLLTITRTANAILTARRLVKSDSDPANVIVCTANVRALGVVPVHAHVGDPVAIEVLGLLVVEAGDTIAIGDALVSDGVGRAVPAGSTGDQNIVGYATSVAAVSTLVSMLAFPLAKYSGTASRALDVTLTVGGEVAHPTHTINVTGVLKDYLGAAVTRAHSFLCYLTDDAAGQTLSTVVLTADAIIGTDGTILKPITAKLVWMVVAEVANGQFDLTFAKTDGAGTVYLQIVLPDGHIKASGAITFSA